MRHPAARRAILEPTASYDTGSEVEDPARTISKPMVLTAHPYSQAIETRLTQYPGSGPSPPVSDLRPYPHKATSVHRLLTSG